MCSASALPSAAPPYAVKIWSSGRDILIEIPGAKDCPAVVLKFPLHEQGLSRALSLLGHRHSDFAGDPEVSRPLHRVHVDPKLEHAAAVLARLGVLKP